MRNVVAVLGLLALALSPLRSAGIEPPGFQFYSFPHVPCSEESRALDVNVYGLVAGTTERNGCESSPIGFSWDNGEIYYLEEDYDGDQITAGVAVSRSGAIVCEASPDRVVIWSDHIVLPMDVPAICEGNGNNSPDGISENGAYAVGDCFSDLTHNTLGVRYDAETGEAIALPLLPDSGPDANAEAYEVTDEGLVVGRVCDGPCRGYYWQDGVITELPNQLGGTYSTARAINNHGLIVGWAEDGNGDYWAMSYDLNTGVQKIIGVGNAWDVNDRGQAVAYSIVGGDSTKVYILYNGETWDLTQYIPPSWVLPHPDSINNYGWVTGWADDPNGNYQAWLLVPINPKGDYDGDDDVDLHDFGHFQECYAAEPYQGPEGGLHVGCSVFDFDDDVDLDGDDFAAFQAAFTGAITSGW